MNKVIQYIFDNSLLERGDRVLVGLSGGPDSVCLLHILYSIREKIGIKIGAIHINHLLRGNEALKDEEYTRILCNRLEVDYFCERINIEDISKQKGISLELAGREERYKAFEKIKERNGYNKVAVAHNSNDQAETIIMRMMRGTGLEGLTGIKAKREDGIIRPILCLKREEIEEYCEINDLNPRLDMSNFEKIYNRNKVRLDILPYMKENFNEEIIDTLNRMVLLLQKDNEFIEDAVDKAYKSYCTTTGKVLKVDKKIFRNEKEAIITRVIKKCIINFSGNSQNFEMKHIYDVIELANRETGKEIHLTNGIIASNSYESVLFKSRIDSLKINNEEVELKKENLPTIAMFNKNKITFEVIHRKNTVEFSNNDLIKYFDYDKIEERILLRTRRNGDKIVPLGMKGTKKLKDIFIDLKIPREKRDEITILCFDEKVSWVVGYKVSEEFKITRNTKKILKISLE